MPNYSVFTNKPEELKVQMFGSDLSTPIAVNNDGKIFIKSVEDTVNITGTITATDLDIRNLINTQDSVQIYGTDGTTNKPILTDTDGKIVISSTGVLSVQATDLDIRNLNNTQDNILIYGLSDSGNTAISTTATGDININHNGRKFFELSLLNVTTGDDYQYTDFIDVSNYSTYSFYVKNTGTTNAADIVLQISPTTNAGDTIDLLLLASLPAGDKDVLVPNKFLRYIRLGYKSTVSLLPTTLDIYFQAHV
ncbi:conserved hypothetical protein [Caldicellulosiruptor hydrothermalis 108]|uniref:DUF6385 domain-containing protein n=1 Tax=Caldicellulosiruptor hydrothermalis (strain DSM 18901 / VKM B-2411 / 108) TaxID=632292 RepID=E4QB30_CALH1|nr:DUF6385 domain-containing protein [Caldicellulosiruptor hydrothermalis]ADQ06008.1 conserved hypothetical protein [Caldicellulosiruptor hydrothermalis 108]